jgi:hypothetical protein
MFGIATRGVRASIGTIVAIAAIGFPTAASAAQGPHTIGQQHAAVESVTRAQPNSEFLALHGVTFSATTNLLEF